ncbi:MAG: 6-phosphofructokinase [Candidatus Omnitrophica bacterium]|nr:6-phosphofructokinase [Candidatus Omnitrophota bacterium]
MSLKGNAIVGQSGGCTAVINQSLVGAAERARSAKTVSNVWGMIHGVEGLLKGELFDLRKQSPALLKQIANQPSAALGSSRYKLKQEEEFQVVRNLKRWNVRYFFMVGGNDTAETILRITSACEKENHEIRAVHIPKTIDNDLMETDHCPGYGSVARFAAITTQEAGLDSRAMQRVDRVKIIELMGRNSGWIVAASALLKKKAEDPPHLLWMPEIPFEESAFLSHVEKALSKAGYCLVVISETIRDKNGMRIGIRQDGVTHDPFGHQYVEGAAAHLARLVEDRFKVRARFDKPGTIARMSMPYVSEVDQKEAYQAGAKAVRWALQGKTKVMVAFKRLASKTYQIDYVPVPIENIPGRERYFPDSFLNREKTNVNETFRKYALPLLGPHLPHFPTLKSTLVALK